ncbi:MAG: hypothetical protein AAFO15_01350 [Pseudomonadota bacterium]
MAKTASKNNPLNRQKQKVFKYNDKEVSFTKLYNINGKSIKTACYSDDSFVTKDKKVLDWQLITNKN